MAGSTGDSGQVYCTNCGESIDAAARFCPECGEEQQADDGGGSGGGQSRTGGGTSARQPRSGGGTSAGQSRAGGGTNARQSHPGGRQNDNRGRSREDIGFVFAFVDSWKRQKTLRHLLNIVLIFASFGTYLILLFLEGLVHYHNLNSGKNEPYQERQDQKVWTTFTTN